MEQIASIDGTLVKGARAVIPVDDLGLQRGYAVFDYARVCCGRIFHLGDHLARFRLSADGLHLALAYSDEEITRMALDLIREFGQPEAGIRLILTGGSATAEPLLERPRFIMIAERLPSYPEAIYTGGVKLVSYEFQRDLPPVKTTNYMNAFRLDSFRRERDAFAILYLWNGRVLESPRDNFFIIRGASLVTARENVLHGITRKVVLELSRDTYAVEERDLLVEELDEADEAFITSTTKRIVPVVRIDDRTIGKGSVGTETRAIMARFRAYEENYKLREDRS